MNNFAKGSEWRKWDLHIHSPLTNLNNQYHNNWEEWINKLVENEIKVIGLTNYFRFAEENGCNEIDIVREKLKDTDIVVFPNLEFRLEQPNKDGDFINLHVLFSNKVSKKDINDFLGRLKTQDNRYCSELKSENDFSQAMISSEKLEQQLKDDFNKEDYLIICCPNGYGGFRANNKQGRSIVIAEKYDKIADFFFARKQDRNYFLDSKRYENAIPKAVVFCSDAHNINGIGGENFTWIKVNPTFEGLRQIMFEPESRIKIQQDKPEAKKDSDVIESVRFESKNNLFISEPIYLNQNLNVVIGGKSTGKSLLLYSMARIFDKSKGEIYKQYNYNLIVKYKDGEEYSLTKPCQRLITYISQGYLQELVKDDESSHKEFTKLINDSLKEIEKYEKLLENFNTTNSTLQSTIITEINNYLTVKAIFKQKIQSFKQLGDIEAKKSEREKNITLIQDIENKSKLSDEDKAHLQSLQSVKTDLTAKGKSKRQIETFLSEVKPLFSLKNLDTQLKEKKSEFTLNLLESEKALIDAISDNLKNIIDQFNSDIEKTITEFDTQIKSEIEATKQEYQKNKIPLENLSNKLVEFQKIEDLQKENERYTNEITAIENAKTELDNLEKKLPIIEGRIVDNYRNIIENYNNFVNDINQNYDNFLDKVTISARMAFDNKLFYEKYTEKYNLQGFQNDKFSLRNYNFGVSSHCQKISSTFKSIISDLNIRFKAGNTEKEVIEALFDTSYFSYKFNLTQGNDDIFKMSQGKKGIVLLKLYLSQKNAKYPILIDQPEDNLDNRTIYSELNNFIKEKKIDRQIIMVTHNANLVVTTDAEQVIVANQAGEDGKDKKEFQFEYLAGALEDTKPKNEKVQGVLYQQGIREHVCEILEGGKDAFKKREEKYGF